MKINKRFTFGVPDTREKTYVFTVIDEVNVTYRIVTHAQII